MPASSLEVDVGNAMPPTHAANMPVLQPSVHSTMPVAATDDGQAHTLLAKDQGRWPA